MESPLRTHDVDELLQHVGWVRGLVSGLVRDPAWRDDVEQQTWLTALTRRSEGVRDLRGWLRMVAINVARQGARRKRRRDWRERAAARPEALPPTDELVEQAELQRRVVEALVELEEPFRTTLLLHFFHGLSSAEIARELRLSASTVRNRLKRGLKLLRARFEVELRSRDERRLFLALLLALPESASDSTLTEPIVHFQTRFAVAFGGAFLLTVLGLWGWWLSARQHRIGLDPVRPALGVADDRGDLRPVLFGFDENRGGGRAPVENAAGGCSAATPEATGRVVDGEGRPVVGVLVTVASFPRFATDPVSIGVACRTDAAGSYLLSSNVSERPGLVLVAEHPGYAPELVDLEEGTLVTLERAALLEGTVFEEETGRPLPNVRITFGEYDWVDGAARRTITDEGGRFVFDRAPAGRPLSARFAASGHVFQSRKIAIAGTGPTRANIYLENGEVLLIAVVDGETGNGLVGAEIIFDFACVGRTEDDGSIVLGGVGRAQRHDLEASLVGYCTARRSFSEGKPLPGGKVVLPLFRECVLEGVVLGPRGEPLPYAIVALHAAPDRSAIDQEPPPGVRLGSYLNGAHSTRTGRDGRFRLDSLAPWLYWEDVRVRHPRSGRVLSGGPVRFPAPGHRESIELAFPIGTASLKGTVFVNDEPVAARITWRGSRVAGESHSDDRGVYLLENLEPGPLEIRVDVAVRSLNTLKRLTMKPGSEESYDIVIVADQAVLAGRIVCADGAPAAEQSVEAYDPERRGGNARATTDAEGAFRMWVEAVPGAHLTVLTRHGPVTVARHPVPAGTQDFELVLPELGMLALWVPDPAGGVAPTEIEVAFRVDASGPFVDLPRSALVPLGEGRWQVTMPVGRCDLTVRGSRGTTRSALLEGVVVKAQAGDAVHTLFLKEQER